MAEPRIAYATTGPPKPSAVKGMVSRMGFMLDNFNGNSALPASRRRITCCRFERVENGLRLILLLCHDAGFEVWDLGDGGHSGSSMHQLSAKRCSGVMGACLFGTWNPPSLLSSQAPVATVPFGGLNRYQRSRVAVSCTSQDGGIKPFLVRIFSLDKHVFDDECPVNERESAVNKENGNKANGSSSSSSSGGGGGVGTDGCEQEGKALLLRFSSRVHAVAGSPRLLLVALATALHGFHPTTLTQVFCVGRFPADPRSDGSCLALSTRWLAFPADRVLASLAATRRRRRGSRDQGREGGGDGTDPLSSLYNNGGGGGGSTGGAGGGGGVDVTGAAQGIVGGLFWLGKKGKKAAGDYLEHRKLLKQQQQKQLQDEDYQRMVQLLDSRNGGAGGVSGDGSNGLPAADNVGASGGGDGYGGPGSRGQTEVEAYQALLPQLSSIAGRVAVVDVCTGSVVAVIRAHVSAPPSVASTVASSVASSVASTVVSATSAATSAAAAAAAAASSRGGGGGGGGGGDSQPSSMRPPTGNGSSSSSSSSSESSYAPASSAHSQASGLDPGEAIEALAWSPSGHALVSAPSSGQTLHVWAAVPSREDAGGGGGGGRTSKRSYSGGGGGLGRGRHRATTAGQVTAPQQKVACLFTSSLENSSGNNSGAPAAAIEFVLLYKLVRGFTPARIRHLSFSSDGLWVTAATARHGTTHVFAVSPTGGPAVDDDSGFSAHAPSSSQALLSAHAPPSAYSPTHGNGPPADSASRGGAVSAAALTEKLAAAAAANNDETAADAATSAAGSSPSNLGKEDAGVSGNGASAAAAAAAARRELNDADDADNSSFALLGEEEVASASDAAAASSSSHSPAVVSTRALARVRSPCVAAFQPQPGSAPEAHQNTDSQKIRNELGGGGGGGGASSSEPSSSQPVPLVVNPTAASPSSLFVPLACVVVGGDAGGAAAVLVATPDGKLARHPITATLVATQRPVGGATPSSCGGGGGREGSEEGSWASSARSSVSRDRAFGSLLSSSPVTSWVMGQQQQQQQPLQSEAPSSLSSSPAAAAAVGNGYTSGPSSRSSSQARKGSGNGFGDSSSPALAYSPHSLSSSPLLASAAGVLWMGLGAVVNSGSGGGGGGEVGGGGVGALKTRLVVEVDQATHWDLARLDDDGDEAANGSGNNDGNATGHRDNRAFPFPNFVEVAAPVAQEVLQEQHAHQWLGHIERRTRAATRAPAWAAPGITFVALKPLAPSRPPTDFAKAGGSRETKASSAVSAAAAALNPLRIESRLALGTRFVVARRPSVLVPAPPPPPPPPPPDSTFTFQGHRSPGCVSSSGDRSGAPSPLPFNSNLGATVLSEDFDDDEGELLQFPVDDD